MKIINTKIDKQNIYKFLKEIVETILGTIIMALATSLFLLPNQLSTGGFAGIATILYYFLNIPMGTTIILINIPLFIWAIYKLGKIFVIKSFIGTAVFSVFINIFDKMMPLTQDRFLACIYGGIFMGLGTAIILKANSSTGGSDLISTIAKKYNPNIRMGNIITILDCAIVGLNMLFFKEIEVGLYSAIAIYLVGKMIDIIFEGVYFTKLIIIISDKNEKIANEITKNIGRGLTGLYGKGMYRDEKKLILMCAIPRKDIGKIKQVAQNIDPHSFLIITNAREVFGLGFKK